MSAEAAFRGWARQVVDATTDRLIESIPGASAGTPSSLRSGYEARYVHFTDHEIPQPLCVWVYSSLAGGDNNFRGTGDVIGVGLKHDADDELDPGEWRFRLQGSRFRWRKHCDDRYAGFRLIEAAEPLRDLSLETAADTIARAVLAQLERAKAIDGS